MPATSLQHRIGSLIVSLKTSISELPSRGVLLSFVLPSRPHATILVRSFSSLGSCHMSASSLVLPARLISPEPCTHPSARCCEKPSGSFAETGSKQLAQWLRWALAQLSREDAKKGGAVVRTGCARSKQEKGPRRSLSPSLPLSLSRFAFHGFCGNICSNICSKYCGKICSKCVTQILQNCDKICGKMCGKIVFCCGKMCGKTGVE